MNWKDDQIEKLILFYSHNSLFLVPDFWYLQLVPETGTRFWYQFSGTAVSGQYVMGISRSFGPVEED